jgi:hypothetical protein
VPGEPDRCHHLLLEVPALLKQHLTGRRGRDVSVTAHEQRGADDALQGSDRA